MYVHARPAFDGQGWVAHRRLPERAVAVALLVLLHAALFLLINRGFGVRSVLRPLREITLSFPAPTPTKFLPAPISPELVKPREPVIAPPQVPQNGVPSSPSAAPDITGIGRSLFNCDLANGANLPPEQRANCLRFGIAPPANGTAEAGMPKNSGAKNEALWAAQLAAKQAPAEVPCTSLQQQVFGGVGAQKPVTTLMADPLCLLNGLLNGFGKAGK